MLFDMGCKISDLKKIQETLQDSYKPTYIYMNDETFDIISKDLPTKIPFGVHIKTSKYFEKDCYIMSDTKLY